MIGEFIRDGVVKKLIGAVFNGHADDPGALGGDRAAGWVRFQRSE